MMIAKLMNIGAAALLVGSVSVVVATNLPATGRTIENEQPNQRSIDPQERRDLAASNRSGGSRGKMRSTSKLLPGLRGRVLEQRREHQQKNGGARRQVSRRSRVSTNISMDLLPGQRLNRGDSLFSTLGAFRLTLQDDGDLALYDIDDNQLKGNVQAVLEHRPEVVQLYTNVIWRAETNVAADDAGQAAYCVMHEDGNFVVYDEAGRLRLESGTRGNAGAFLRCQNDGNLVIYKPDMTAIWTSATDAGDRTGRESGKLDSTVNGESGE